MVRTRHHPGEYKDNGDSPVDFLCLESKAGRRTQKTSRDDYNSDDSGVVHNSRSAGRGKQTSEHVQRSFQSRLRPKIRSSGAYFIGEGMSSDEEEFPCVSTDSPSRGRRVGRPSKPRRKRNSSGGRRDSKASTDNSPITIEGHDGDEDEPGYDHDDDGGRRRSTRQKKNTFDTLNQNFLDKAVVSAKDNDNEDGRGKKRRKANFMKPTEKEEFSDMYSRVKRQRKQVERDMYGVPIQGSDSESGDSNDEQEGDGTPVQPQKRSYFLREHKPRTQLFEAPPIESQKKKQQSLFRETPPRSIRRLESHQTYQSPAHRKKIVRKRQAFHVSSSTSSSESISSDEERFQRRKAKSMARSRNRCLPMNLNQEDLQSGVVKERSKIGASLADVDPMNIDRSVTFESIGGLGKHIRALKEMIVFPIMYPEIFERFKIAPPRGVLFHGPPGTGKTLIARALANECSSSDRRVAFFMRKGADCLSKWVGESERQLRLLFDQAYQMRPSIIFFDEIDGLAPVRSSRQDQIHSSIVSTLLALMDGLDSRGEIVVIGATNRIDSIDPALRRPGRFDREFLFPLPSHSARKQILKIHTKAWSPKLADGFVTELAQRCVGYCGADLKALCTEAALHASRRRYPQIYTSNEKLQLNVSSIHISAKDFFKGMQAIVPTAQRSVSSPSRSLTFAVEPLLKRQFQKSLSLLQDVFPSVLSTLASLDIPATNSQAENQKGEVTLDELASDDDEEMPSIYEKCRNRKRSSLEPPIPDHAPAYLNFGRQSYQVPTTYRPRLLLCGSRGQGQTSHLGPAILHHLEQLPVQVLDLPTVYAASAKTPEESCAQVFREARRCSPSIVYMPYVDQWWEVLSETLRATFLTMIQDLDPTTPILILATSEVPYPQIDCLLQLLFDSHAGEVLEMRDPQADERREYFQDLLLNQAIKPPPLKKQAALRMLEVLPKAPPPVPAKLTEAESKKLKQQEEATFRELRIFLRDVLNKLGRDRKFSIFTKPVDVEDVPDYYEIIQSPMDLSTMMSKIDLHAYQTVADFLGDINQISLNALEYNPDRDPSDKAIRHRACALRDTAQAIIEAELDPEFEKLCHSIAQSQKRRGVVKEPVTPAFYFTRPLHKQGEQQQHQQHPSNSTPHDPAAPGVRHSRRVKGLVAEDLPALELVEKQWQVDKRVSRTSQKESPSHSSPKYKKNSPSSRQHQDTHNSAAPNSPTKTPSSGKKAKPKKKCIWAVTKRRKKRGAAAKKQKTSDVTNDATSLYVDIEEEVSDDSDSEIIIAESPCRREIDSGSKHSPCQPSSSGKDTPASNFMSCKKSPTSRCLELMPGHDSGVGSSVDSNGDSVDSIDHAKEKDRKLLEHSSGATDMVGNEEESQDLESQKKFRSTKSRLQTQQQQRALELLEESLPPLVFDLPRLQRLLDKVVIVTDNYCLERLEKLYSVFSQCIYRHRKDYDKTELSEELETKLDHHSKQWPSSV
ncbi:ATPase family AAA domain-containing protein 2-like isoform X3 [Haliotis rufescens]|uniref:ATPase family AAA domain-containing protein 2-like isoform X3 n=1 Tax=Haliotis rufescens TaxID=6454 RepID=UPI001EAFCDB7|nr:ATPase family AAA domain-containing protein 2-like isoform X3 [Haliotis rufescens]